MTHISKTSYMHYVKLICRSVLFALALALYVVRRVSGTGELLNKFKKLPWILAVIWIIYAVEMFLRFFPSRLESPGCQKQFSRNFIATKEETPKLLPWKRTLAVILSWIGLNSIIGVLYFTKIIDTSILVLICLAYGVCDMICILFFCPFQTWFMKNRCCTDCRIYNWDFAMMFTPLVFIPSIYTWSLLGMSLLLLIRWEATLKCHPERFAENTNACISCKNCNEKLCSHKKQLRGFIQKNKEKLCIKGNKIIENIRDHKKKR